MTTREIDLMYLREKGRVKFMDEIDVGESDLLRKFTIMDADKLAKIGKAFQEQVVAAVDQYPLHPQEGILLTDFLNRMHAFVEVLRTWVEPQSMEDALHHRCKLDNLTINLLYTQRVQNIFAEYLNFLLDVVYQTDEVQGELVFLTDFKSEPMLQSTGSSIQRITEIFGGTKVFLVLNALKTIVSSCDDISYFGLIGPILKCSKRQRDQLKLTDGQRIEELKVLSLLSEILELFHFRIDQTKTPFQMLSNNQERWDKTLKQIVSVYQDESDQIIIDFVQMTRVLLCANQKQSKEAKSLIHEQLGDAPLQTLFGQFLEKYKLGRDINDLNPKIVEALFEKMAIHLSATMCQEFDLIEKKKQKFAQNIDPAIVIKNLIQIVNETLNTENSFEPMVAIGAFKVLCRFCNLDLNQDFGYSDESKNPYFLEICKYFPVYIAMLQKFTAFYDEKTYIQGFLPYIQTQIQEDISAFDVVMDEDSNINKFGSLVYPIELSFHKRTIKLPAIASQRLLMSLLEFMLRISSSRLKGIQSRLFPLLGDPLIKLVTAKPSNETYHLNLAIQQKALKILKEVTRFNSFDNTGNLMLLIQRLKLEFTNFTETIHHEERRTKGISGWHNSIFDDLRSERQHLLENQQLFIRQTLRFLCYTIIRTDPNQISLNQNYVSHSRKILDSGLFQDCIMKYIDVQESSRLNSTKSLSERKEIQKVLLGCLQLFTFVFNDLPQKLKDFFDNGIIPKVVSFLCKSETPSDSSLLKQLEKDDIDYEYQGSIPLGSDVFVVIFKFLNMIQLDKRGEQLIDETQIYSQILRLGMEVQAYPELQVNEQSERRFDYRSFFRQFANLNETQANLAIGTILEMINDLIRIGWKNAQAYFIMEQLNDAIGDQKHPECVQRRENLGQRQTNFEKMAVNVCEMFNYILAEEIELFVYNNDYESNIRTVLTERKEEIENTFLRFITTPTISSTADNCLQGLSEALFTFYMLNSNPELNYFIEYLRTLKGLIENQFRDLQLLLNLNEVSEQHINNDRVENFKPNPNCVLAEREVYVDYKAILFGDQNEFKYNGLKGRDQFYITVSKISAYLELLYKGHDFTNFFTSAQTKSFDDNIRKFFLNEEFIQGRNSLMGKMLWLQMLLRSLKNDKYLTRVNKQFSDFAIETILKTDPGQQTMLKSVDFSEFYFLSSVHNKSELAMNAYYATSYNKIRSYQPDEVAIDMKAIPNFALDLRPIESDLPESMKALDVIQQCLKLQINLCKRIKTNQLDADSNLAFIVRKSIGTRIKYVIQNLDNVNLECREFIERTRNALEEGVLSEEKFIKETLNGILKIEAFSMPVLIEIQHAYKIKTDFKRINHMMMVYFINKLMKNGAVTKISSIVHFIISLLDMYEQDRKYPKLMIIYKKLTALMKEVFEALEQLTNFSWLIQDTAKEFYIFYLTKSFQKSMPSSLQLSKAQLRSDIYNYIQRPLADFFKDLPYSLVLKYMDRNVLANYYKLFQSVSSNQFVLALNLPLQQKLQLDIDTSQWNIDPQEQQQRQQKLEESHVETQKSVIETIMIPLQSIMMDTPNLNGFENNSVTLAQVREGCLYSYCSQLSHIVSNYKLLDGQMEKDLIKFICTKFWDLFKQLVQVTNQDEEQSDWPLILMYQVILTNQRFHEEGIDILVLNDFRLEIFIQMMTHRLALKVKNAQLQENSQAFLSMERYSDLQQQYVNFFKEQGCLTLSDQSQEKMKDIKDRLLANLALQKKLNDQLRDFKEHFVFADSISQGIQASRDFEIIHSMTVGAQTSSITNILSHSFNNEKEKEKDSTGQDAIFSVFRQLKDQLTKSVEKYGPVTPWLSTNEQGEDKKPGYQIPQTGVISAIMGLKDQEKVGETMRLQFESYQLFIDGIRKIPRSFYKNYSSEITSAFLQGLNMLKDILLVGQIGQFEPRSAFFQSGVLSSLLKANIVDKDFTVDLQERSILAQYDKNNPKQTTQAFDQVSALLSLSLLPRKEIFKEYERNFKKLLFLQFVQNIKRHENIDILDHILSLHNSKSALLPSNLPAKQGSKSQQKSSSHGQQQQPTTTTTGGGVQAQAAQQLNVTNIKKNIKRLLAKYSDKHNEYILAEFLGEIQPVCVEYPNAHVDVMLQVLRKICLLKQIWIPKGYYTEGFNKRYLLICKEGSLVGDNSQNNNSPNKEEGKGGKSKSIEQQEDFGTKISERLEMLLKEKINEEPKEGAQSESQIEACHRVNEKYFILVKSANHAELLSKIGKFEIDGCGQFIVRVVTKEDESLMFENVKRPEKESQQFKIVLKRQVLKECFNDQDLLIQNNNSGQQENNRQSVSQTKSLASISNAQLNKTQTEVVNQLLDAIIDQNRGTKMDILKIIKNPFNFLKKNQDPNENIILQVNETQIELVNSSQKDIRPENEESKGDSSDPSKLSKPMHMKLLTHQDDRLTGQSTTALEHYFLDIHCIIKCLVRLFYNFNIEEVIYKHNNGKTLKFLLRNLFFLTQMQVRGGVSPSDTKDKPTFEISMAEQWKGMKKEGVIAPKTIGVFFHHLISIYKRNVIVHSKTALDIRKVMVQEIVKNLMISQQLKKSHSQVPQELAKSLLQCTNTFVQYSTIWLMDIALLKQMLYSSLQSEESDKALWYQKQKLMQQLKVHITKQIMLECQHSLISQMQQYSGGTNNKMHQNQQTLQRQPHSLAFLAQIRNLLDSLENGPNNCLLFRESKVACMNKCIWLVTSVLKIFERKKDLFVQLMGPPPPDSQSSSSSGADADDDGMHSDTYGQMVDGFVGSEEGEDDGHEGAGNGDQSMDSSNQGEDHSSLNQAIREQLGLNGSQSDSEDYDSEEGEEELSEDEYGSESNVHDDLSSNHNYDSVMDDMRGGRNQQLDDSDDSLLDDISDYDSEDFSSDEDNSSMIETIQIPGIQNIARSSVKGGTGGGASPDLNMIEIVEEIPSDQEESQANQNRQIASQIAEVMQQGIQQRNGENQDINNDDANLSYYDEDEGYEPSSFDEDQGDYDDLMSEDGWNTLDEDAEELEPTVEQEEMRHHHHHHHFHGAHMPNIVLETAITISFNFPFTQLINQRREYISKTYQSLLKIPGVFYNSIQTINGKGEKNQVNQDEDQLVKLQIEEINQEPKIEESKEVEQGKSTVQEVPLQTNLQQTLTLDGLDPIFMENLGPQGLLNIAESIQIQNQVVGQAENSNSRQLQEHLDTISRTLQAQPLSIQDQIMRQVEQQLQNQPGSQDFLRQNQNLILRELNQVFGSQAGFNQGLLPPGLRLFGENIDNVVLETQPIQFGEAHGDEQQIILPQNHNQQQTNQRRDRFLSMETMSFDFRGPNDASRMVNNTNQASGADANQRSAQGGNLQSLVFNNLAENKKQSKVKIISNQFQQNVFNFLHYLQEKFESSEQVSQTDTKSTDLLKNCLLPSENETDEEKYSKIADCIRIAQLGFKTFDFEDQSIMSRIVLLYKIPHLRTCLILKVLKLLVQEVSNLQAHETKVLAGDLPKGPYQSKEKIPYNNKTVQLKKPNQKQQTTVNEMVEMTASETVLYVMDIMEQLQSTAEQFIKNKLIRGDEITERISANPMMARFSQLMGGFSDSQNFDDKSILEILISQVRTYFTTMNRSPWLQDKEIHDEQLMQKEYQNVLGSLVKILAPLKLDKADRQHPKGLDLQHSLVEEISALVITPQASHLSSKQTNTYTRKILNFFRDPVSSSKIAKYLDNLLNQQLLQIQSNLQPKEVNILQKEASDQISLKVNFDQTKELLKVAGGIDHLASSNICNARTLSQLFDQVKSYLLSEQQLQNQSQTQAVKTQIDGQRDNISGVTIPLSTSNDPHQTFPETQSHDLATTQQQQAITNNNSNNTSTFIYREDVKDLIGIMFALCEYNLRIIFAQAVGNSSAANTVNTGGKTTCQQLTVEDDGNRVTPDKGQTGGFANDMGAHHLGTSTGAGTATVAETGDATLGKTQSQSVSPDKGDIEQKMIIDTEGNTAEGGEGKTINTNIKANLDHQVDYEEILMSKIGQFSQTPEDKIRLKAIMGFFIQNRKLINLFIRANHQVVNVQLKNLVLKVPEILEFDTKRLVWRIMLKKAKRSQGLGGHAMSINVRRDQAFDDSYAVLAAEPGPNWKTQLQVTFEGEEGVDEGGLKKEWFSLLSKQIFDEDRALFLKASQGSTYFPNPKSDAHDDYLDQFKFIGKFVGKAMHDQQLLDCYFVKAFYKQILEMPLDHTDLEDYDQELYNSLKWMLENSGVENLCTYFVETEDYYGEQRQKELCEDGANKLVTDDNKAEYVRLVANFRLSKAIQTQMEAFKEGVFTVVPKNLIKIFDNRELELLISGLQVVDIDDLKENTLYKGYNAHSKPVQLLWETLQEFDNSERAEFIQFVTGSSKVPVEGFKGLRGSEGIQKFTVVKVNSSDQNRLPQAHTCFNQLDLPMYEDKETTKRNILIAIKEGKQFHIA